MKSLLREFISLIIEQTQKFVWLSGPVKPLKDTFNYIGIYRTFALQIGGGQIDDAEHEILIDVDAEINRSQFKGDPDEFELYDWQVVGVDQQLLLTENDIAIIKNIVGDLTEEELDKIQTSLIDRGI